MLPLENLSHDPEQEYFAEGLTEALITTLARIGELRVVSRTSAMQYKGVHRPLCDIAQELRVDGIIEGTVLRAGQRVRISTQLLDARTDTHLWAENYDRDLRDILALHSEVAQAIAQQVPGQTDSLRPRSPVASTPRRTRGIRGLFEGLLLLEPAPRRIQTSHPALPRGD